jgi:hypothetical protein
MALSKKSCSLVSFLNSYFFDKLILEVLGVPFAEQIHSIVSMARFSQIIILGLGIKLSFIYWSNG